MNEFRNSLSSLIIGVGLCVFADDPTVFIHETFESHASGPLTAKAPLHRSEQIEIINGGGRVGAGKVAHFNDASDSVGGAMEYCAGSSAPGRLYVEFDLLNNKMGELPSKNVLIFSIAKWDTSRSLSLNANAKRAFGIEFLQDLAGDSLLLRVGSERIAKDYVDMSRPLNVKVWVNDHDSSTMAYKRPDTGEEALLESDSFVLWINNELVAYQLPSGNKMYAPISTGDAVLGRVGFGSASHSLVNFLIDNFHVEDPTGESGKLSSSSSGQERNVQESTKEQIAGTTPVPYRTGENEMNLFVVRPEGWAASDRRPAFIYFFGGGWTKGTPEKSVGWARWAAKQGMVGIAPDYRTKSRFGTSPLESVADGRAAFNWVVENADKLGVDPRRVAVGGSSAGGHVAIWTAISETPPGSSSEETASIKPAALFLNAAVTDTSVATGYTPKRFGENALALSPYHQLDEEMPPTIIIHACDDELVFYRTAVELYKKLKGTGNECELISVPRGGHGYSTEYPEWKMKVSKLVTEFFIEHHVL